MTSLILAVLAALIAITFAAPESQGKTPSKIQAMMADMNAKIAALSPNARVAAEGIRDTFMNMKLSKDEKMKKKMELISGLTPAEKGEIQGLLKYYMEHYHISAAMKKEWEAGVAALSPNAQAAAMKVHVMWMNGMELSMQEKMKKKDEILMNLTEPEKIEVNTLIKTMMSKYPIHGH